MSEAEIDALTVAVAANLKELRQAQDLTLDELAKRSGVSRTMLHQVETGRSTPSIAVLWKIATGLDVPFNRLLQGQERSGPAVLRHDQAKLLFNHQQTFSSRALFPFDGHSRHAEFYELVLKPGGSEVAEPHAPGTTEYLVLAHGSRLVVEVDGQSTELKQRDALVFAADVLHAYRNPDRAAEAIAYLMMTYHVNG